MELIPYEIQYNKSTNHGKDSIKQMDKTWKRFYKRKVQNKGI